MKEGYVDIHTHHPTEAVTIRTVGIHPWQAEAAELPDIEAVTAADAVGEIGLDRACTVDFAQQQALFAAQLLLAERCRKVVVVHCVRAFEEVMRSLADRRLPAVILHGFIGSPEQALRAIARGYFLSFGTRTAHSPKTIEALRITPLAQLFVETDEATIPIERIYAEVAALRGLPIEELRQATLRNFERIFGK